jgi:PAS domain S-box-containing protein
MMRMTRTDAAQTLERLNQLLAGSLVVLYACAPAPPYAARFVSQNVREQMGYEPEEFTTDPNFWARNLHPEDSSRVMTEWAASLEKGQHVMEYRFRHKDGTYRWVRDEAKLVRDSEGRPVEFVGNWSDITERKQAEEALRESKERFKAQYKGIPVPTYTWQGEADDLRLVDYNDAAHGITQGRIVELLGQTARQLYRDNPETLGELLKCYEEKVNLRRERWHRLASTGEVKYLVIYYVFVPPDLVMVHTADLSERKWLEETLERETEFSESLIRSLPGTFYLFDPAGKVLRWNRNLETVSEYPAEEIAQMSALDFIAAEDHLLVAQRIQEVLEQGAGEAEAQLLSKSGKKTPYLFTGVSIMVASKPYVVGLGLDISQRKRAEEALRERKEYAEGLIAAMKDGFSVLDVRGVHVDVNAALCQMTGFAREELIGSGPPHPYWPPEAIAEIEQAFQGTLQGQFANFELTFRRKNGERFPVIVSPSCLKDGRGNIRYCFATVKDITELEKAWKALQESEAKYRTLFEEALDAIFVADSETGVLVDCNRAACELVGREKSELVGQPQRLLHPPQETEGEFSQTFRQHRAEKLGQMLAARVMTKQGGIKDVEIKANVSELGGRRLLQGIFRDITERKRAEAVFRTQRDLAMALGAAGGLEEGLRLCFEAALQVSTMDCGGVYLADETSGALDLVFHQGLRPDFIQSVSHYDADSANAQLVMAGRPVYTEHLQLEVPLTEAERAEGLRAMAVLPLRHENRVIGCLNLASHRLAQVPLFARATLEIISGQMGQALTHLRTQEALRRSEGLYSSLVETVPLMIFRKDGRGRFTFANRAFCASLGRSFDQVVGRTDLDFYPRPLAEKYRQDDQRVMETGATFEDIEAHQQPDGRELSVQVWKTPLHDATGQVVGVQGIFADVTARKRAEEALRVSHRLLEITNRHTEMIPLLKEFVTEVRNFTGCAAVGIRLLDEEGNIPYQAHEGFSRRFYMSFG